jgi:DNA-binding response OmpR family regulator
MNITNRMKSHPAVIVVSRLPEESRQLDAIEAGAQGYVAAPFEPQRLGGLLRACMAQPVNVAMTAA